MSGSVFKLDQYKHLGPVYEQRKKMFGDYWRHYKKKAGPGLASFQTTTGAMIGSRIGNAVRPLFNPIPRAVDIDVGLLPGEWKTTLDPKGAEAEALAALFKASRWPVTGDLYCKYYAAMGEAGIRIVDDQNGGRVYLAAVRPDTYVIQGDPYNPSLAIFVETRKGADGGDVEMATVMEPGNFYHYINGAPAAFGPDRPASYTNAQNRVPLVVAVRDCGDGRPEPTFDNAIDSLSVVNEQANHMAEIIRRHAEPQWAAFGAEPGDLEKSGESVWFFPEGSDVRAILAAVDFPGLLAFVQEIKEEMKNSLPELALRELVGVERVAAATIELQMAEPVIKIKAMRKPLDAALEAAIEAAGGAAGTINAAANLRPLAEGVVAFDPKRPVITVDTLTMLQIDNQRTSTQLAQLALERERMLDG